MTLACIMQVMNSIDLKIEIDIEIESKSTPSMVISSVNETVAIDFLLF